MFVTVSGLNQMESWPRWRRQCHKRDCMEYHYRRHNGRREGDFDVGWFRPEAALWDCRWGYATTHDSFTLFFIQAAAAVTENLSPRKMFTQKRMSSWSDGRHSFWGHLCLHVSNGRSSIRLNRVCAKSLSAWTNTGVLCLSVCLLFVWGTLGYWSFLKWVAVAKQIKINKLSIFLLYRLSRGQA